MRRRRRRRWAHAPAIRAASYVHHEKRVAWVSISTHTCGSFSIVMVLRLAALQAAGAPLLNSVLLTARLPRVATVTDTLEVITLIVRDTNFFVTAGRRLSLTRILF